MRDKIKKIKGMTIKSDIKKMIKTKEITKRNKDQIG